MKKANINLDFVKKAPVFIKKNKKPIIIIGAILLLGITFTAIAKAKKKDVDNKDAPRGTGVSWPLKRKLGTLTTPAEVVQIKRLQNYLNREISYVDTKLVVDGYFGAKTEEQVQLFLGVKEVSYKLFQEIIEGIKS